MLHQWYIPARLCWLFFVGWPGFLGAAQFRFIISDRVAVCPLALIVASCVAMVLHRIMPLIAPMTGLCLGTHRLSCLLSLFTGIRYILTPFRSCASLTPLQCLWRQGKRWDQRCRACILWKNACRRLKWRDGSRHTFLNSRRYLPNLQGFPEVWPGHQTVRVVWHSRMSHYKICGGWQRSF